VERRSSNDFVVEPGDGGRLDHFLVRHLERCSRRQARRLIDAGAVLVNGRAARKGGALRANDVVAVDRSILDQQPAAQAELHLPVLFADETLVAIDKPAGMPAVALRPGDRDTVANYLLGGYPELRQVGSARFEAGLVHRLDTATSGVLVAARSMSAWHALRAEFGARRVGKLYLAVVAGIVRTPGVVSAPIAHHPRRPREMCACTEARRATALRARPASTRYRPLQRFGAATLLAVRIATGVRHQIRVHLAAIGHPVLGDETYGDAAAAGAAPRLLLHASRLSIAHPSGGARVRIRSPLPVDFQIALGDLATSTG